MIQHAVGNDLTHPHGWGSVPSGDGGIPHNHCATGAPSPLRKPKFEFAPELPVHLLSPRDAQGTWWIARVRYQREVSVVEAFDDAGIVWCIPQTIITTRYTNRTRRERHIPLFREYVPACVPAGGHESQLYVRNGVLDVICVSDQKKFVKQLDQVYTANKIEPLDPYPYTAEGKTCRVRSGKFEGFEGVVIRRQDGGSIVVLQLGKLGGASIPMDFTPDELEAVD